MREKELVSVIIPTRNVGLYLDNTLKSLLLQTYQELEIIVMDYKSTDCTVSLLEQYSNPSDVLFDPRVSWYPVDKAGVSYARNMGLAMANGEYIVFLDGDDVVEKDYIEYLLSQMTGVELASCGYDMMSDVACMYQTPESTKRVLSREDMLCRLFYLINDQGYVWNKMYRRSVIEQYHLRFHEDLHYGEDRMFLVEYVLHSQKVRMAPEVKYHYQMREHSAMDEKRESLADVDTLSPERLEKQATEVLAYVKMRKLLRKYPDAKWLCSQVAVYTALQLYSTIESAENPSIYRKSKFRKHIRKLRFVEYFGDADDAYLHQCMLTYGRTGRVTL